jgi:hypothetical protein
MKTENHADVLNDISYDKRGAAFKVYTKIGPGLSNKKLGLLINFNENSLKKSIVRIVNNL